jgi:hypothetical protein
MQENQLKTCKTCGKIIPKRKNTSWKEYNKRIYCSNACCSSDQEFRELIKKKNEERYNKNNRVTINCVICGKEFKVQKSKMEGRQRYSTCDNPECRKRNHKKIAVLGYKAAKDKLLEARLKRAIENERYTVKCGCGCGTVFAIKKSEFDDKVNGRAFYNREHYEKWFRGENTTNWLGGEINYYGPNWTIQRARTRKRDGNCQVCGISPKELGQELCVHHIVPFRYCEDYIQANKMSNLICLCVDCHMYVHANLRFKGYAPLGAIEKAKRDNLGYKIWQTSLC